MMTLSLNELGHQLLGWLAPLSIELAALAVLILAAGHLLPIRSPALRHLLWLAVLVKPLAALLVSSHYTVYAPLVPLAEPGSPLADLHVEHLAVEAAAFPPIAESSTRLAAAGWVALLWLLGAALLSGRILIGHGILHRLRRQAHVQRHGPLFAALRQARASLHCHTGVEVATSPSIRSPMVLGILRPVILVPAELVDRVRTDELSLVLMHELAHVRRCDNLVLLLQRLVTAALFFHPALWLCGRMLRREAERACDDLVVGATGRPEAYARGLTLVAEGAAHVNQSARSIPMMSTLAATGSDLSQRIRRTLDGRARRMGPRARVLAVILLCPLAALTLPSYGVADSTADEVTAAAGVASASVSADGIRGEEVAADSEEERRTVLVEPGPDSTTEWTVEAMERRIRESIRRRIQEATDGGEPVPELLLRILDNHSMIRDMAEAGLKCQECARIKRGTAQSDLRNLFLVVYRDGSMKLNEKPVTLETLGDELQAKRQLVVNNRMVIQHDERAPDGQVVQVMDVVRQAGLVSLGYPVIATEEGHGTLQDALSTDPEAWSGALKARLLELQPGSTIEEVSDLVRHRRNWLNPGAAAPDSWSDEPYGTLDKDCRGCPQETATGTE